MRTKPRKEAALAKYQDLMTHNSSVIAACGVKSEDIVKYTHEPKSYVHLTQAIKWFTTYLQPLIDDLNGHAGRYPPGGWAIMPSSHPDMRHLKNKQRAVREMWFNRLRFNQ